MRKVLTIIPLILAGCGGRTSVQEVSETLKQKFLRLRWVAYSPTNYDPTKGIYPSEESVREDLRVLRQVGFKGLITYGAKGTLASIPRLAKGEGFEGVVMGVWSPLDSAELSSAAEAAREVDGYCVGNEGLGQSYSLEQLQSAMNWLRTAAGRPVTTSEQVDDYLLDSSLLALGDWVFPNAHPYWHGYTEPTSAVEWTRQQYAVLTNSAKGGFVFFKEVGLPSEGAAGLSEDAQAEYYRLLASTEVKFAYFEAFDQPWKTWASVEPHWGLFRSDRTPKKVVSVLPPDSLISLHAKRKGGERG